MKPVVYVSLILLNYLAVGLKLFLQMRIDKINPNVIFKQKTTSEVTLSETLLRFALFFWIALIVFEFFFGVIVPKWFETVWADIAAVGVTALGVFLFVFSMFSMKSSWRIGIDQETKTELVKSGIYRFSRNPVFVGLDLMMIGLFLTFPDFLTAVFAAANIAAIHFQILQEEKHLERNIGEPYINYKKSTARYFLFF